jgi:glycosyltransferase involved in cell wall biosynthesis
VRNLILLTNRCYPVSKDLIPTGLRAYLLPKHLLQWGWRTIIITQWTGEAGGTEPCSINEIPDQLRGLPKDQIIVLPIKAEDSFGRMLITLSRRIHRNAENKKLFRPVLHGIASFFSTLALFMTGATHITGGGWTWPAARTAIRTSKTLKIDAVLATSGWDSAIAAQRCSRHTGIPWVQYFQDAWQMFVPRIARPLYGVYYHYKVLSSASAICHCTPGWTRESSLELHRPVTCIIGGYDAEQMATVGAKQFDHFTIVFAGSAEIGIRDPKWLFEGISRLYHDAPKLVDGLEVLYIGWNEEIFIQRAKETGTLERLHCLGTLPPEEVIPYLNGAHLLQLMLDQTDDYNVGRLSGKVGEYVGSGRPILLIGQTDAGIETDLVRLIRDCGIGWVARNADDVVVVLRRLLEQYRTLGATTRPSGGKYLAGGFSWQRQAQKLALVLDRVARGERDPIVENLQAEYPWSRTD